MIGAGPSALINAVLRKVTAHTLEDGWSSCVGGETDETKIASIRYAHPEWIVRALRQSLVAHGRAVDEINELLEADNAAPVVNLVALPGLGSLDEALEDGATPGELVEDSALSSGGDLGRLASVREGTTRVQDVGSQLVARALAAVELGAARHRGGARTLAGPLRRTRRKGRPARRPGPAAGRHAAGQRACPAPRQAGPPGSGRRPRARPGRSAPATAGTWAPSSPELRPGPRGRALQRPGRPAPPAGVPLAPHARGPRGSGPAAARTARHRPGRGQPRRRGGLRDLLAAPGRNHGRGHRCPPETRDLELLDAGAALDGVSLTGNLGAGHESTAQLWPHIHSTDAMFLALIRKKAPPARTP